MKKKLLFTFIVLMFNYIGFSQTFTTQWQKCVGGSGQDILYSIISITNGGYISVGATTSNDGDIVGNHGFIYSDAWLIKNSAGGSVLWSKVYGGSGGDEFRQVIQTNDGGFLAVGSTYSNEGDVSGNRGGSDAWVVKINSVGTIVWQKCYGGSDNESFTSLLQTSDGGYLCIGTTRSNDGDVTGNHSFNGFDDAWVVKINNVGSLEWQKCYGGELFEKVHDAIPTPSGGFLFVGATNSTITAEWDAWVVEINSSGNIEWQKTYDGISNNNSYNADYFYKVIQTFDGGFLAVGSMNGTSSADNSSDAWVVKINSTGSIEWQKNYGGTVFDRFTTVISTPDNYFAIVGETLSTDGDVLGNGGKSIWMLKINSIGTILWQKFFGGSFYEYGNSLINIGNGEYIIVGYTNSNDGDVSGNHGDYDGWLIKFKVTNFNLFPNYPCQDKYERLTSEGCNGTTRWYMYLAGQTPTLISSSPNFNYLVPTNLPVQTPIFFECWCLNILGGQTMIGSGYARVLGVANHNLSSPINDISVTPPLPYNASHKIVATNKINGNNTNVEYRAEESISLLPGFQSDANTVFKAHIGGCNQ